MIVVQQPFSGGHNTMAALKLRSARPVGGEQHRGIVVKAHMQGKYGGWTGRYLLGDG